MAKSSLLSLTGSDKPNVNNKDSMPPSYMRKAGKAKMAPPFGKGGKVKPKPKSKGK
jgi:hypothetical protein